MTITLAHHATSPSARSSGWRPPRPPKVPECALQSTWTSLQERRFDRLRAALVDQGGFVEADHLIGLMRTHWDQPISRVARWIASREAVSVTWRGQPWLPLFQFERPSLDIAPVVSLVMCDLRPVYDDWELAEWFARPHDLLAGRSPACELARTPCAVREAARRDRFVNRW